MYFALLFPTLGVIGFTEVIAANRFLYLPMIALLIPMGFLAASAWGQKRYLADAEIARVVVGLCLCACVGEAIASRRAIVPWRDTVHLFDHLASVAPRAPKVRYNYANALSDAGRKEEAVREYEAAIALRPHFDQAHNNLAATLDALGRADEATKHFEKAITLNPGNARARNSYGAVLLAAARWIRPSCNCAKPPGSIQT